MYIGSEFMKLFDIIIDNKKYSFIDTVRDNGKNYIAYSDEDGNIYISELEIEKSKINFKETSEEEIQKVRRLMNI
jgi:hypothetical protein